MSLGTTDPRDFTKLKPLINELSRKTTIFAAVPNKTLITYPKDGKACFADPQRGNIRYELRRFFPQWNGLALVLGKKGFGLPTDHLLKINESPTSQWVTSDADVWRGLMRELQEYPRVFSRMIFPLQPPE